MNKLFTRIIIWCGLPLFFILVYPIANDMASNPNDLRPFWYHYMMASVLFGIICAVIYLIYQLFR